MEQPQNQEQQENQNLEEKDQNQEEFKETEYKGDEEAEAELKQENLNKEKVPEKQEKKEKKEKKEEKDKSGKPKIEKTANYPRPKVPITKIEYVEYVFPKKKINPFPNLPIRYLLQEVKRKTEPRSHSQSNTYLPSFGRERYGFMPLPRRPVPMFRPLPFGIPPRPPQMSPMPPFDMLMNQGMRPMPSLPRRFPLGPMAGPRFPPKFQPRPFHIPPPLPPRTQPFFYPPRPQTGFGSYYNQTRSFFAGNEGMDFSGIPRYPRPPYQRYAYPPPQRRYAQFYKNYQPEETVNRTDYFVEKNNNLQQEEQEDYEPRYGRASYYTYTMSGPRRNRTTRSVSSGRSDGRFTFNLGRNLPIRTMCKRVDNRRLARTKKPKINTVNFTQGTNYGAGSSSRTGVRKVYQFHN